MSHEDPPRFRPGFPGPPGDRLVAAARSGSPAEELIDIVDEDDRVIGTLPRGEATARGLRHRCVFVFVRDGAGRVFVHRRTADKLVFPSMYDMFVGGVVGAGESYDDAALREAEEELGVSGLPRPTPVLTFLYVGSGAAAGHTWWSRVYEVRCTLPVSPQPEEVAWHAFLGEEELERRLPEWDWVPDGLEAYRRLRAHRRGTGVDQSG
jgi:isopentenyldiphosphate isomerase